MSYANQVIDGTPAIWLQSWGWAAAKPAKDFTIGEFMRWNGGSCSKVVGVAKETAKTITLTMEYFNSKTTTATAERTFKKDRWVAIGSEKSFRYC